MSSFSNGNNLEKFGFRKLSKEEINEKKTQQANEFAQQQTNENNLLTRHDAPRNTNSMQVSLPPEYQNLKRLSIKDNKHLLFVIRKCHLFSNVFFIRVLCNISRVPKSFAQLENLTTLSIVNVRLKEFPKHLWVLTRLGVLNLSKNEIERIPEGVLMKFEFLTQLNVSENRLRLLPKDTGYALQLRELDVSKTLIATLPASLFTVKYGDARRKWTMINLSNCIMKELPAEMFACKIENLNVENSQFFGDNPATAACQIGSVFKFSPQMKEPSSSLFDLMVRELSRVDPITLTELPEIMLDQVMPCRNCAVCGEYVRSNALEVSVLSDLLWRSSVQNITYTDGSVPVMWVNVAFCLHHIVNKRRDYIVINYSKIIVLDPVCKKRAIALLGKFLGLKHMPTIPGSSRVAKFDARKQAAKKKTPSVFSL